MIFLFVFLDCESEIWMKMNLNYGRVCPVFDS
jgi:hypothetical protein